SAEALKSELERTEALLPPSPARRRLVRPPQGATSVVSLLRCARAGYVTALWSRDSDDCRTRRPEEVAGRVAPDALGSGDVVLLHEGQSWTLEALPVILERLRAARYDLVTMSEIAGFVPESARG